MKKDKQEKVRYLMLETRIRKKKREYFFLVKDYYTGITYKKPTFYDYPSFRKTFRSKVEARKYGFETAAKLEARYKNIFFILYDLYA